MWGEECSGLGCYCWESCQGQMMQNSPVLGCSRQGDNRHAGHRVRGEDVQRAPLRGLNSRIENFRERPESQQIQMSAVQVWRLRRRELSSVGRGPQWEFWPGEGDSIIKTVLRAMGSDVERQGGPGAEEESCHKTALSAAK